MRKWSLQWPGTRAKIHKASEWQSLDSNPILSAFKSHAFFPVWRQNLLPTSMKPNVSIVLSLFSFHRRFTHLLSEMCFVPYEVGHHLHITKHTISNMVCWVYISICFYPVPPLGVPCIFLARIRQNQQINTKKHELLTGDNSYYHLRCTS